MAEKGEPYLLFDIGDHADRFNFVTEATLGQANIQLMNQIGYHNVTIGNNEGITFSKEQLNNLYKDASFKVLVNNLHCDGQRPEWLKPYHIHHCGDIKVGVIGTTIDFSTFYEQLGWKIDDPVQAVYHNVNEIRDQVDFIVVLSHIGFSSDQRMANNVPGIDLILGAHTHHVLLEGYKVKNTWIHQVGKFGQYVGHATIERDKRNLFSVKLNGYDVQNEKPHAATLQLIQDLEQQAARMLDDQVTVLDQPAEIDWHNESTLGNILAESLKDWCQASVSIVNAGQMLDSLPSGIVTLGDIHRICPHPINPCKLILSGQEIWDILQRSLEESMQLKEIKGFGFRGKLLGMLNIDGLEAMYHVVNEQKRIVQVNIGGMPLSMEEKYDVATIDMFTFGKIIPEIAEKTDVQFYLPEFLREVIAKRLAKEGLERAQNNRWLEVKS